MISAIGKQTIFKRSSGFTLIEILLVVLILAVIVAAAIPRFEGTFKQMQARSCAQKIYQLALFAKERAILENSDYKLKYDSDKNKIYILKKVGDQFKPLESRLGKSIQLRQSITLKWNRSSKEILFTPNGESDKVEIHLNLNNNRLFTIIVGNPIGRITLKDVT